MCRAGFRETTEFSLYSSGIPIMFSLLNAVWVLPVQNIRLLKFSGIRKSLTWAYKQNPPTPARRRV